MQIAIPGMKNVGNPDPGFFRHLFNPHQRSPSLFLERHHPEQENRLSRPTAEKADLRPARWRGGRFIHRDPLGEMASISQHSFELFSLMFDLNGAFQLNNQNSSSARRITAWQQLRRPRSPTRP